MEGDIHQLIDLAQLAEASGWDGIFLEDYISFWSGQDAPVYDPWLTYAAIAMRTERIKLGITVTPLARRRPWKVARESVTLDHLSHGRLILSVGLGDTHDKSFTAFGEEADPRVRAEMLDESLDILMGLWSGASFQYDGKHYHAEEITFLPRPVQQPRIPIWVGGMWPRKRPSRRAARWDGYMTPDDIRELRSFVAQERATHGLPAVDDPIAPYEIVTERRTPGDDPERAREIVRPYAEAGLTWWLDYVGPAFGDAAAMRTRIEQGPPSVDD